MTTPKIARKTLFRYCRDCKCTIDKKSKYWETKDTTKRCYTSYVQCDYCYQTYGGTLTNPQQLNRIQPKDKS